MKPIQQNLVDLVLPVFNEAHVLEQSVRRLFEAMADRREFSWRIVIVDNGSTDQTATIARRLAEQLQRLEFLHLDAKGRGGALYAVWQQTDAEFSIYMDVDLSTDLVAVSQTVALLREGADLVTGSRLHRDSEITRCLKRDVLSRGYNRLIRWILHTRSFDDAQCGFKGVRIESIRRVLPLVVDREWFFDTELLVLAEYAGLKVRMLPIKWIEDPDSRVNIPQTIRQDIQGLARLRRTARSLVRTIEESRAVGR